MNRLSVDAFVESLSVELPPLARIDSLKVSDEPDGDFAEFEIRESESIAGAFQPISADTAICPDCERELFDPQDRRYLYPFINCTNCGPRFHHHQGHSLRPPGDDHGGIYALRCLPQRNTPTRSTGGFMRNRWPAPTAARTSG